LTLLIIFDQTEESYLLFSLSKCIAQPLSVDDPTVVSALNAYYSVQPADLPPSVADSAISIQASFAMIAIAIVTLLL
jgi:hypothetical protein